MATSDRAEMRKVAIVTLGCGRNEVDSEHAAGLLAASGFEVVDDPERADAVVVNTCAFIESAKTESIETVLGATELKERGGAKAVLVMGCMAERYTQELRAEHPEVTNRPGTSPTAAPAQVTAPAPSSGLVPPGRRALPLVFPAPAGAAFPSRPAPRAPVALVKLAEGCDRDCSFCAIPSFRGRFRSRR